MIEKTSVIEKNVKIGSNCYIGHFTLIRPNVKIGNNSEIRSHCFVGSDVKIGNNVNIMHMSDICMGTIIEDCVWIGSKFASTNTKKIKHVRNFDLVITPSIIKYGARIASSVTLLPGVIIGRNALIGAGSVVTKNVPDNEVWFGNPAKKIKTVPEDERL